MTTADIAQLAGVTRRHATGQIVKRPGFPAPCINASQRLRAWPTKKVLAYFQGIGRTIEPASGTFEVRRPTRRAPTEIDAPKRPAWAGRLDRCVRPLWPKRGRP